MWIQWKRTVGCILLLGLLSIAAAGCGSRTELNEISIVSASGIDWKNGKWIVSYQLVLPQAIASHTTGASSGAAPINVFSTTGDTIRGAISKASYEMSRRLYFSQNQIVVISDQAAKHGLTSLFDAYLRNPDSRETVSVFLTKQTAREVLEHLIPLEEIPGAAIERMSLNEEKNGSTLPHMSMYRVLLDLLGPTKATGVASIDISGSDPLDSMQKMSKTYSSSKIKLGQLGILQEDKLVGWISHADSYGVMWMRNQIHSSSLWFPCSSQQSAEQAVMRVNRTKTKLKVKKDKDNWKLHVQVKAKGTLMEYPCDSDLTKPASVAELERAAADKLAKLIEDSFKSVQEKKADILGFGEAVRLQYPKQWNAMAGRWNEQIFPQTTVETEVHVTIERTGMSTDSFRKMQSKAGT